MDPETVEITVHALQRFLERKRGKHHLRGTDRRIRKLLSQSRELSSFKHHDADAQFFLAGTWCFVVVENRLVTVLEADQSQLSGLRRKRKKERSLPKKWKWR